MKCKPTFTVSLWRHTFTSLAIACAFFSRDVHALENCGALKTLTLQGTAITSAGMQPSGSFVTPDGQPIASLPAFCRVIGKLRPTADSEIGFELWMPPAKNWNGRLLAVGNGGTVGNIRYDELQPALRRGYAVVASDSGHADSVEDHKTPLKWGVGHPDKIADWAYRSVHAMTVAARVLVRRFEERDAAHAYYFGCSTGGGQGLMAAQRYPKDFDGIVAGAPGFNRTSLTLGFLWAGAHNLQSKAGYIPPAKLPLINHAAIQSCDAVDGLVDGLIADPRQCHFDPSFLQCKNNVDAPDCLTTAQIDTLKTLYAGAKNPRTGAQIYPGWPVGSESGYDGGWTFAIEGPQPFRSDFFGDWIFQDPHWDWHTFDWDKDVDIVHAVIGHIVDATDPDLGAFKKHGGKLILYQGWADPIGNAYDTINYYESVEATVKDTRSFARLFMAPGMGHCRGGIGPNEFDAIGTLELWVEKGQAPQRIIALKSAATDTTGGLAIGTPDKTLGRTRPLCAYPSSARYKGSGSIDDADNFVCVAGK